MLDEIAAGRSVSSRGRFNPRGVKRKMSNFNVCHSRWRRIRLSEGDCNGPPAALVAAVAAGTVASAAACGWIVTR